MLRVDFIYDVDCPNVDAARANLRAACHRVGIEPRWDEHRIGQEELVDRARGYGSPTILVDGRDVADVDAGAEQCCRIYGSGGGIPPVELIAEALAKAFKQ